MENLFSVLEKSRLFAGIKPEELVLLLKCIGAAKKTYEKGTLIFDTTENTRYIGLVIEGSIHLVQTDIWGNQHVLLRIGQGETFGEAFLAGEETAFSISVTASENSFVLLLDFKRVVKVCSSACSFHSRLIENILQLLAQKNVLLRQKIEHLSKKSIREKLMSYLLTQSFHNKSSRFDLPFNRQELADYLAVDRSALSRELSKMKAEKILNYAGAHFEILKADD